MFSKPLILLGSNHWLEKRMANPTNVPLPNFCGIAMLFSVATTFKLSCLKYNRMEKRYDIRK